MPREEDMLIIAAKLCSELQESFPSLTFGEVSLCFELGAKGEYGEFMGLNMRTFARWLKAYRTSELRYRAVVERERGRQAANTTSYVKRGCCNGCTAVIAKAIRWSG